MKTTFRVIRTFSTKANKQINLKIKVPELIDKFEEEFIKDADHYELPLLKENSILAYTNRFAKSVINLQNITAEKKKRQFKVIKQSMLRNNKLTPFSCIQLCESLVHFSFQGDESRILEMLRNYAEQSRLVFNVNSIDRFNISYKYLMVDKIMGPIKFVNFQLGQDDFDKLHLVNKMRYLFADNRITTNNVKEWDLKREVQFELKVGEKVRRIKIKGYKSNLKVDQQELLAKEISKLVEKDQKVMLVKGNNQQEYDISPQQLAKQLLVDSKNWHNLNQYPYQSMKDHNQSFSSLVSMIRTKIKYHNEHLKIIEVTPMNYLNSILSLQSEAAMKQLFGYIKFNTFHTEIQKLLQLLGLEKRQQLKQLFPLSFPSMLQIEEKQQYNFITPQMLAAKSMVDLIVRTDAKTFNFYLDQQSIYQYLYFFINYAKSRDKWQAEQINQNRDIKIVKNKLAITSVLYAFKLNMPVLQTSINILQKNMFPLTYQYRYPNKSH